MLISISGAQGSGKSTILSEIKRLGYNVIERKTSRSILSDWNVTLDQVYSDSALMRAFQDELLNRKEADEADALASSTLWFTERSYADVFTYALIILGSANKNSDWLNVYYDRCKELNAKYGLIFYVTPFTTSNVENDGVRGINQHYTRLVDSTLYATLERMAWDDRTYKPNFDLKVVETDNANDRVIQIVRSAHDKWLNLSFNPRGDQFVINVQEFLKDSKPKPQVANTEDAP